MNLKIKIIDNFLEEDVFIGIQNIVMGDYLHGTLIVFKMNVFRFLRI